MSLDPELGPLLEFFEELGMPDPATATPQSMREAFVAIPIEEPTQVASVENRTIPGPGGDLIVRIFRPEGNGPFPLMLFYHGGGWVVGDLDSHDETARQFCAGAEVVVVSVDYRLAPEAKFPGPLDDCYAATCWAVDNAAELGADGSRLVVSGDSAGGNLAAAVALMARDKRAPAIAHQLLIYPVTARNFDTASYLDNAEGPVLTRDMMRWFWDHYLESEADAENPLAAPLHANLAGLPSATVITAGYDPLRDEGIAYAKALAAAGVQVEQRLFEGMIHGFVTMPPGLTQTAVAMDYLCQRLRGAL